MELFDLYEGGVSRRPRESVKKSQSSGRGGAEDRVGMIVRLSERAVLFFDDLVGYEYWIPFVAVKDWWFTASNGKKGLDIKDLELDDEVTLVIARWLLVKEKVNKG